jgi:hypothetical protein
MTDDSTDWFARLTGFAEGTWADTRARLAVEGDELVSRVNGQRYGIGQLELPSLAELRQRAGEQALPQGRPRLRIARGDARLLHRRAEFAGALFQVASQFNLLEMVSSEVTPEEGVSRYAQDPTQGPACAIAAGAATIYRNYLVPVGEGTGQTRERQIDTLADLGEALASATGLAVNELWTMRNGYALCKPAGLQAIDRHLAGLDETGRDALRRRLRIGWHRDVEVTDAPGSARPRVSQALCSALPVAYSRIPSLRWERFARLVLEAAYESTLLAGALNAARGQSDVVLLTRVGGGAFGNEGTWIDDSIAWALQRVEHLRLDVRVITLGVASQRLVGLAEVYP